MNLPKRLVGWYGKDGKDCYCLNLSVTDVFGVLFEKVLACLVIYAEVAFWVGSIYVAPDVAVRSFVRSLWSLLSRIPP